MRPRLFIFLAALTVFCSGCASFFGHAENSGARAIYIGVRNDCSAIIEPENPNDVGLGFIDLPGSFVVDTIYMPVDVWTFLFAHPQPPGSLEAVKGWKCWYANLQPPNQPTNHPNYVIEQTILDDYPKFVENLKHKYPSPYVSEVYFYGDGDGQHAVRLVIETDLRDYREYYLMYDKSNARVKVIKGSHWHQFHM